MAWKHIEDAKVRQRWVHPVVQAPDPDCSGDKEVFVDPSFYADAGTPICSECGEDMLYDRTEVDLPDDVEALRKILKFPKVRP